MSLKLILAVDDDLDIQKLLSVFLNTKYRLETASNGKEALEKLCAGKELPDLILLDLEMPVMDGPALKKELDRDPCLARIPVIYLTAHTELTDFIQHSSEIEFLNKPIEKDDLLNILQTHFSLS